MKRGRKPLIKKVDWQWYAFGKRGKYGGQALYCAISFCEKLNKADAKEKKE